MKVKELITRLLDLPREADISVTTKINGENISYPIKDFDVDLSYSHIVFDNYGTLELKGEDKSEQSDNEFNHESFYEFLLNTINPNEMEKYRSMFLSSGEIVN